MEEKEEAEGKPPIIHKRKKKEKNSIPGKKPKKKNFKKSLNILMKIRKRCRNYQHGRSPW